MDTSEPITTKTLKIYTDKAARVLKFMQGGCTESQAAEAVGVTLGYVSQLCQESDFKEQIGVKLQEDFEAAIETDKNYAEVELEMSRKLKKMAPYVLTLDDMLKTAKIINSTKKKVAPAVNPGQVSPNNGTKTIRMILPIQVINNNFIINPNSEVVAVGDRELTTLNANSIDAVSRRILDQAELEDKSKPIPKIDFQTSITREMVKENATPSGRNKDKYGNL